jgi:hypothetical protein
MSCGIKYRLYGVTVYFRDRGIRIDLAHRLYERVTADIAESRRKLRIHYTAKYCGPDRAADGAEKLRAGGHLSEPLFSECTLHRDIEYRHRDAEPEPEYHHACAEHDVACLRAYR